MIGSLCQKLIQQLLRTESCNFGLQTVRRRVQMYVHIDLMGNRTHSSRGHSQSFEWNLLAMSEHGCGEPKRLGNRKGWGHHKLDAEEQWQQIKWRQS